MLNGTSTITPNSILNDPTFKLLDKWIESSLVYKDYIRLGFINFHNHPTSLILEKNSFDNQNIDSNDLENKSSLFRICTLNNTYQLCRSYPALFIVSKETTDDCIKKNTKCHRQNR